MVESEVATAKVVWVDLATSDTSRAGAFYASLLGWEIDEPDPAYGGYTMARTGGKDLAGIGPKQMPEQPAAWSLYVGTLDVAALAEKVTAGGGAVIAPPMEIGDQGWMAVFADPVGAVFGAWQAKAMRGFATHAPGAFAWAELNARGIDAATSFYADIFGWATKLSDMPDAGPYTEFQVDGHSVAGGTEMNPMVPAEMPSHWLVYFGVEDVDATFAKAIALGGREMVSPTDFPGGRFAILGDPEGVAFGLMKMRTP